MSQDSWYLMVPPFSMSCVTSDKAFLFAVKGNLVFRSLIFLWTLISFSLDHFIVIAVSSLAFSSHKLCLLDQLIQLRQLELKLTGIMRGIPSSCLVLLLRCEGLDSRTPVLESVLSPDSISNPSQNTSGWSAGPKYISQTGFELVVLHFCRPSAGISGVPPCPSLSDF